MAAYVPSANMHLTGLDAEVQFNAPAAESVGWLPLGQGTYMHHGAMSNPAAQEVIQVVGIPDTAKPRLNVLLLQ